MRRERRAATDSLRATFGELGVRLAEAAGQQTPAPNVMTRMLPLLLVLLAACGASPPMAPTALPEMRHGHRIERLEHGYLCFGGFGRSTDGDRGTRACSMLRDGSREWQPRQPLNHGHAFFASATIDGVVYAIGEAVERYDAQRDTWRVLVEPGHLPRSHFGAAAVGDKIYVLGGFPKIGTGFHVVDTGNGTVSEAAAPPSFTHGDHFHFVCSLAGELHVLGGIGNNGMHTAHWVRRDEAWQRLADCPEGLWTKFAAHAVHDDKLYLFSEAGGFCYDPADATWRPRARPPHMVAMPAAVATGNSIWVVGGIQVKQRTNVFWRYDISEDRFDTQARSL